MGRRVVTALGAEPGVGLRAAGIVIAAELTPADAAALDPALVLGIATARGTATAHAAILARALGLPAVVGLGESVLGIAEQTGLLLDGEAGTVLVDPPADVIREAEEQRQRVAERRASARARAHEPAATRDGIRIEVFANLGSVDEAARAVELGAEGVGGPDHQACNRQDTCFPQDHAYDVHALCADGHADSDLLGALDDHVGDHSVKTRSGRQRGEKLKKPESVAINSSFSVPCLTLGCEMFHRFSSLRSLCCLH